MYQPAAAETWTLIFKDSIVYRTLYQLTIVLEEFEYDTSQWISR